MTSKDIHTLESFQNQVQMKTRITRAWELVLSEKLYFEQWIYLQCKDTTVYDDVGFHKVAGFLHKNTLKMFWQRLCGNVK